MKARNNAIGTALLVLLGAAPGAARAQVLTLTDALARAEGGAYANRIAAGQAEAQAAQATGALRGMLPTLRLESGFMRTTDPIGAFGTTLRQRRITQNDFSPGLLNDPAVATNYTGGLVLEAPLFNVDAYLGRSAAVRAGKASDATAAWTRAGTRVDVIRAYFGAVLAAEQVATLEAAARAAHAHVDQAGKVVAAGLATRSDALLAEVKAGDVDANLVEAEGEAGLARRRLAVLLGLPDDTTSRVPDRLPSAAVVEGLLQQATLTAQMESRGDVAAARLGESAARYDVRRALSLYLPRVNAFGRYDWNSPGRLFGGDRNWTAGIMASWTPFAGASELADRQAAGGRVAAAAAGLDAARANASLEVAAAESGRKVALARLEIAQRGAEQSAEAHRIVTRKYEGGLATVLELLDAAATETQARLGLAQARYTGIVAEATRRRALGLDPAEITTSLELDTAGASR